MNIGQFEQNIDEKVLPLIKEQLMLAYTNGYKEAEEEWRDMTIEEYKTKHNIDRVIDLDLPSGTIWYRKQISFKEISTGDIKLSTKEQNTELLQCKWHKRADKICIMGLNGERFYFGHPREKICLWNQDSKQNEFYSMGWLYDVEQDKFISEQVFSGEKFWTLLVLPDNLKKDI